MATGSAPRVARWLIRTGSLLAPAKSRARLFRQWEADLVHRSQAGSNGWEDFVWALGILPHALHLRRREAGMGRWTVDLGQALRSLRRRPALAAAAVAILAVGIGSATAVASVAERLLLRPLPFPDGDRLVRIWSRNPVRGFQRSSVSWPDFNDVRQSDVLAGAAIYSQAAVDLAGDVAAERIRVAEVGPSFFDVLGAEGLVGRVLGAADDAADAPPTIVLSEGLWRRRWGADPTVVGRTVRLDGRGYTVVGVLATEHAWPIGADAWIAYGWGGSPPAWADRRDNHTFQVVARLAPGTDAELATTRLSQVVARARSDLPQGDDERDWRVHVVPLQRSLYSVETPRLALLAGLAVLAVMLVACLNVAGLLLVQGRRRARELSLRAALGADRSRLIRQVLLESGLLAVVGGAAGTALALVLMRAFARVAPAAFAGAHAVRLDPTVLMAALALSLLAALVAGTAPAVAAGRAEPAPSLREGSRGGGSRRRGQRALVVVEVGLSVVLLLASGLVLRSFQTQLATDPGFRAEGLLTFSLVLPSGRYEEPDDILAFYRRTEEELGALPGVREVALTSTTPFNGGGLELVRAFLPEGAPEPPDGPEQIAQWVEVDSHYLETLGISPTRGRAFTRTDDANSEPVMMVSERMARLLAPDGEAPVGMKVRSWRDENVYRTVVGVFPDHLVTQIGSGSTFPMVLVPNAQSPRASRAFLLRVDGDPTSLVPAVRQVVARVDADLAVANVSTLADIHRSALAPLRFLGGLFSAFGAVALLLTVAGVYGLVAFSVATRTREIGIRMAVGASEGQVRGMVLGEGARVGGLGLVLGLAAGAFFARALVGNLQGVAWLDPRAWALVVVVLGASVVVATLVPSMRASRVDPARTLNAE